MSRIFRGRCELVLMLPYSRRHCNAGRLPIRLMTDLHTSHIVGRHDCDKGIPAIGDALCRQLGGHPFERAQE